MSDLAVLLSELAIAPNMPAARCAGRHELFDGTIEATRIGRTAAAELADARTEAKRLCSGCPELARCAAWVDALPKKDRPQGVIAGRLNVRTQPSKPRKRTAA